MRLQKSFPSDQSQLSLFSSSNANLDIAEAFSVSPEPVPDMF